MIFTKMQQEWLDLICEVKVMPDYSGRNMFGETTMAIVCTPAKFKNIQTMLVDNIADSNVNDSLKEDLKNLAIMLIKSREDELGKYDHVYY